MGRGDLRTQALDLLRFPLAVVVLSIHVFSSDGLIIQGETSGWVDYPIFAEFNTFIDAFLRKQSVPIYYFISGYVFFLGVEMTRVTYLRKFKNRVHSLLIPYVVWNTLAVLLLILTLHSPFTQYATYESSFDFSLLNFLSCYWVYDGGLAGLSLDTLYPLDLPLWFLRDLMVVVLCTPLVYAVIKQTKYYAVLLVGVLWLFEPLYSSRFPLDRMGFLTAFFFFSFGAYMSINRRDMLVEFGRLFKVSIALYILLGSGYVLAQHCFPVAMPMLKQMNILVGLLFAYNLAAWLLKRGVCKVNPFLASASFFIYISHWLIVKKVLKLLYIAFQPSNDWALLLIHSLTVILVVGFLLGVFYLMERYAPRLLKVVAGRK